jgi:hypothetical protein
VRNCICEGENEVMKKVLAVVLLMVASGLFLSAQDSGKGTIAGSWKGSFADSVGSGTLYVTLKQGSSGNVSGNYEASSRGSGTVTGEIHSDTLEFILTQQAPGCTGSYTGKLKVNGSSASGTYWGDDCSGRHENGVISLTLAGYETPSAAQPSNSAERSTSDYVPCGAPTISLHASPSSGIALEELDMGSPVTIEGQEGDWFKIKSPSGKVGYINKFWMCKKTEYVGSVPKTASSTTATDSTANTQPPRPAQTPGIPPGTMLAVAWRAQPWTTTTYYQQPGSSSTNCTGSGNWLGPFWNGSASCTSTYTPAQNVPITWTHYTIYNLVETANSWMVLSCTRNWAFSQCRYMVPGESFQFEIGGGQAWVIGQKKVKFNIVAFQPKTSR